MGTGRVLRVGATAHFLVAFVATGRCRPVAVVKRRFTRLDDAVRLADISRRVESTALDDVAAAWHWTGRCKLVETGLWRSGHVVQRRSSLSARLNRRLDPHTHQTVTKVCVDPRTSGRSVDAGRSLGSGAGGSY